jgi:uncharacterized repeat protein (TIGR01451 family)
MMRGEGTVRGDGRLRLLALAAALVAALALALIGPPDRTDAAVGPTDLQLTKTDNPDPVTVGGLLTYTIEVRNLGVGATADASDVVVTDQLDPQVDFVSVTASDGACERKGKTITCQLGQINAGSSETVTIQVRPKKEGTIANVATVTSPEDTTPLNNADTETTTVGPAGPSCGGSTPTIVGTPGADTITGTDQRDVIVTFAGNDTVFALGGNDVVCTRSGADVARGGTGGDRLIGGKGGDTLAGKSGDDTLKGKGGRDRLRGRGGSDLLNGGSGRDSCKGGAGRDVEKRCP